jgi:hypothetical protein
MAAQEFDDVAALVNQWRADTLPARRPGVALPPDLRAELHVARGLDAGRVTDGLGDRLAAEIEVWLETQP